MENFNITLGQYVKGDSYLYKLDPRFKIIGTIILMVAIFLIPATKLVNCYVLLGFLAFLLIILITGKVNIISVLKGLRPILFIGIFTVVLQLLYSQTGTLITDFVLNFSWLTIILAVLLFIFWFFTSKYVKFKMTYMFLMLVGIFLIFNYVDVGSFMKYAFAIYTDGLVKGGFFFGRIVLIVMLSTILTMTTSTTDINLGLEWLLHPLTYIKIPVAEFAMMLSLTLRFIPTLMLETEKIMKAQASRGIDFNEGNIINKAKQIVTLLIPMFVISINRAEDLSNAMEARGYVIGAKRTSVDELKFSLADAFSFITVIGVLIAVIVLRVVL